MEPSELGSPEEGERRAALSGSFKRHFWKLFIILPVVWIGIEVALLPFGHIASLATLNPAGTAFMEEHEERAKASGKAFRPRQEWVQLSRVPRHVRDAVIVAEDGQFWSHDGFDWYEFRVSLRRNIREGRAARGASTITQQLVKNLYLSSSKNPLRKMREWILTWWMEQKLTKRRILELYLNVIEWGDGVYGIQAASRWYFGKEVGALTREEGARLAAVIPNPRRYRPDAETRYVIRRTGMILDRMAQRGM